MPETSRECVVVLLDETSFSVPVKPTLLGSDLLDMAASHMKVKEKDYFSLYVDGEGYKNWLEMDKPVLDPSQDLPKGSQSVKIYFAFKYFIHNLRYFNDFMTVELLYLQSRQAIFKGEILTDEETVFELAACVMQAQHGDFKSDEEAKQQLSHLPVLPVNIFNSKSVHYCEERVMSYYRMMNGLSRGEAVFKYLDIIQSLPMYSMHFFEVKDKKDVPLWLGVGPDGICECLKHDKNEQTNRFQWLQLQNIYYKDKKFSMEVYRSNARAGRKGALLGPVSVHAWYGSSSKVIIAIWKMARDQHMFYRSKRTTRDPQAGMNLTEIIRQLNKHHRSNISPSSSHSSLSMDSAKSNPQQASAEAVAAAKAAQSEMYQALLSRRSALVIEFEKKAARYKEILIKEMQITGIPPDGLTPEEIERMRKKFGVSFKFSKFVLDKGLQGGDEVESLEKEVEINQSILRANKTLLDQTSNRKLKKDRKKDIKSMEEKLQKLEDKVEELKKSKRSSTSSAGSKYQMDSPTSSVLAIPGSVPVNRRRSGTPGGGSIDDNFLASMIFDTPSKPTSHGTTSPPLNLQKSPLHKSTSALNEMPMATSTPPTGSFTLPNKQHTTVSSSHSMTPANYQGHSTHPQPGYEYSYSDNYSRYSHGNDPSTRFLVGGDPYADEYDLSPPGSLVSGSGSVFSPPNSNTSRRSDHGLGLRESNLTDDFLQHFSNARGHPQHHPQQHHYATDNHTPPTGMRSERSFNSRIPVPRKSNVSDSVVIPGNSSPITRYKRASSPTLGFPVEGKAGYVQMHRGQREYSPDNHDPSYHAPHAQYHHPHQQQQIPHHYGYGQDVQYRSPQTLPHSYQTPSPISSGNYSQHYPQGSSSMGKPSPHGGTAPSMTRKAPPTNQPSPQKPHPTHQYGGHSGQTRNNALWYDDNSGIESMSGNAVQAGGHPHRMSGGGHMTGGQRKNQPGGQVVDQVPPNAQTQGITLPRQQSEGSYDLEEMLKIWDSSSKSPFGEGTLV